MAGRVHPPERQSTSQDASMPPPLAAAEGERTGRKLSTAAVIARANDARQRLEAKRPTNRVVDLAFTSADVQIQSGGGLLAGAIAFRFFLFMIPYVFVVVMVFGLASDFANADPHEVAQKAGIAGIVATAIQSASDVSTLTRWVTLGIAVFALYSGARNLLKALLVAHALIWKVPMRKLAHPTRATLGLLIVTTAVVALLDLVYAMRSVSLLAWLIALTLFILVPSGIWLLCSIRLFPGSPDRGWHDLWPGALLFGVGAELLHLVTVVWASRSIESKSETYGAIGAALTILLWAYLLGRLVVSAAALNAALWRSSHPEVVDVTSPADHVG